MVDEDRPGLTRCHGTSFADITNLANSSRLARLSGLSAPSVVAIVLADLNALAVADSVTDFPWPAVLRAKTKLQTLTGGAAPHVISQVIVET